MTRDHVAEFIEAGADPDVSVASPAALLDAHTRYCERIRHVSHRLDVDRCLREAGLLPEALDMPDEIAFERRDERFGVATDAVEGDCHVGEGRSHSAEGHQRRRIGFTQLQRVFHRVLQFVAVMTAFLVRLRKGMAR